MFKCLFCSTAIVLGVYLLYNVCLTCKMSWVLALFLTCDCFPGDQNTGLGIKQFNVVS